MLACLLTVLFGATACAGGSTTPGSSESNTHPWQMNSHIKPLVNLPTAFTPAVRRPNVLVIEADDMRVDELRFMPNVQRLLMDRGVTWMNSFAPYPLCCPSRTSLLDGKYTHNTHVFTSGAPYAFHAFNDSDTLATRLQAGGYLTALVGKYLNGYGSLPQYHSTKPSTHYVPPGWTEWRAGDDHGYPAGSPLRGGTYAYFSMTQITNGGKIVAHPGKYSTELTGRQTRGLIGAFHRRHKPWFIWWTPVAPHFGSPKEADDPAPVKDASGKIINYVTPARPSWIRGAFNKVITKPAGQPAHGPAEPPADMAKKPAWLRELPEQNAAGLKADTVLTRQRAEALFVLDQEVGKTLRRLKRTGQYDNTIVMFTSDNGYYLGEHRKPQGKVTLHEPSLRVPLVMAGPGVHQGVRYDPISTVDIAATIAALTGTKPPHLTDGVNMVPVLMGHDQGWRIPVITEGNMGGITDLPNHMPGFNSPLNERGLRLGRWKMTGYDTREHELYDLQTDPLEMHNLAGDPRYAGMLAKMTKLWLHYTSCAGPACSQPLPAWASATPAEEKAITDHELAATAQNYADPGWLAGLERLASVMAGH